MMAEIMTAPVAKTAFYAAKTRKAKLIKQLSIPLFFATAFFVSGCDEEKAPLVPADTLEKIQIPAPKFAPQNGIWSSAYASKNGDRLVNYMDGNTLWISLRFLDCNLPMIKEAAKKPEKGKLGDFASCILPPNAKLKDYAMWAPNEDYRAVKVGHLVLISATGGGVRDKIDGTNVEAFLGTLDLQALAKL